MIQVDCTVMLRITCNCTHYYVEWNGLSTESVAELLTANLCDLLRIHTCILLRHTVSITYIKQLKEEPSIPEVYNQISVQD
jgi:hypothetical protein